MTTYCEWWPECSCGWSWRRWQLIAEEDEEWNPNQLQLDYAEIDIRNLLDCVAHRCPDPKFRRHATVQLMHPVFGGHFEHKASRGGRYGERRAKETTMSKLKPDTWDTLPRQSKLAAAMYPDKVPEHIRRQMLAANPGMASRLGPLLEPRPSLTSTDYSKVPGLIPVRRR